MKNAGKPRFSAEILDPILASGKAEELQSGADLFAFAFLFAGRRVLSIDDALDIDALEERTARPLEPQVWAQVGNAVAQVLPNGPE